MTCQTNRPDCLCRGGFFLEDLPPPKNNEERAMHRCLLDRITQSDCITPFTLPCVPGPGTGAAWFASDEYQYGLPRLPRMHGKHVMLSTTGDGPRWRPKRPRFATLRRLLYSGVRDGLDCVSKAHVTRFDSGAPGEVK